MTATMTAADARAFPAGERVSSIIRVTAALAEPVAVTEPVGKPKSVAEPVAVTEPVGNSITEP